jgi:hypothetical protein
LFCVDVVLFVMIIEMLAMYSISLFVIKTSDIAG